MSAVAEQRTLPTQIARGGSRAGALLPAITALALALAAVPTSVLFTDQAWVPPTLITIAAVCGVGGLLRALPVPLLVVPLAQSAAAAAAMAWLFGGGSSGPWAALLAYRDLVADGVAAVRTSTAPVDSTPEFLALLALVAFLASLLVETLAVGMGLAGLSGIVLLLMAITPLGIYPSGSGWLLLVGPAMGWAMLMAADYSARLRGSSNDRPPLSRSGSSLAGASGLALVAALSSAVILSAAMPAAGQTDWLRTWFAGVTGSPAQTTGVDPFVSVASRLRSGSDAELLRYRTSGGASYLGLVTLESFDGTGWRPYERVGGPPLTQPAPNSAASDGPALDIEVGGLSSVYLPLPDGTRSVALAGDSSDWSWDPRTGDAVGDGASAAGTVYRVRTAALPAGPAELAASARSVAAPSPTTRTLPAPLSEPLAELTAQVTAGATDPIEQAFLLQRWFTDIGGFSYSLDVPDPGTRDPLLAFLADRVGFCQQYATAMAAMARSAGIPARVVVGFAGGTEQADGSHRVTANDAHAWPELWLSGSGWVRFEPTPALGSAAVEPPGYTPPQPQQEPPAAEEPSVPEEAPVDRAVPENPDESAAADGPSSWPTRFLSLVGVLLLFASLLAVPAVVRRRRRRSRLARASTGDADAAWLEVQDCAIDAGLAWPAGGTPRQQAGVVQAALAGIGAGQPSAAGRSGLQLAPTDSPEIALGGVLGAVEMARYAPVGVSRAAAGATVLVLDEPAPASEQVGDLALQVEGVIDALADLPRPFVDRVWPRSLRR